MSFRVQITDAEVERAFAHVRKALKETVLAKGAGAFVSPCEALGAVTEEYHEFVEAIRSGPIGEIHDEAVDIAVASIWAIASSLT
jgi:hypothetical protein